MTEVNDSEDQLDSEISKTLPKLMAELVDLRKRQVPAPRTLSAFGVEIGGWGALLALIISLITAFWTMYATFLAKPAPHLVRPIILNVFCSQSYRDKTLNRKVCNTDSHFVLRAGPFLFMNDSFAETSYLLADGRANVSFLGSAPERDSVALRWQFFSDATNSGVKKSSASPIEVSSLTPQALEIEFFPRRRFNEDGEIEFIDRYLFSDFQAQVADGSIDKLKIDFVFTIYPDKSTLTVSCSLTLGKDFVANAEAETFTLFSRDCDESQWS